MDPISEGANIPSNNARCADNDYLIVHRLPVSPINSSPSSLLPHHHDTYSHDGQGSSQPQSPWIIQPPISSSISTIIRPAEMWLVMMMIIYMIDDSYFSSREHHRHNNLRAHYDHHCPCGPINNNSNNSYKTYGGWDLWWSCWASHRHGHDINNHIANMRRAVRSMAAYDDTSIYSNYSQIKRSTARVGVARCRRPGIPHSNICTVCSTYIYIDASLVA